MSEPANDVSPAVDMPVAEVVVTLSRSGKISLRFPSDPRLAQQMLLKGLDVLLSEAFEPRDVKPKSRIVGVGAPIPGIRS